MVIFETENKFVPFFSSFSLFLSKSNFLILNA